MPLPSLPTRTFIVLLNCVLFLLLGCKQSSTEPTSGGQGQYKIAFVSFRGSNDIGIYVMNADGTHQARLTSDSLISLYPEWSPDGSRIAYVQHTTSGYSVYTISRSGRDQTLLSTTAGDDWDERPTWSPDGRKITFWGSVGFGIGGIYVMNSDGTHPQLLASGSSPSWSRDGSKIVFLSGSPRQVFIMNADGTNQLRLTNDATSARDPTWSPDGTRIAFTTTRTGNSDIYTMNADGSNQIRLTDAPGEDIAPNWSPDGTSIVFLSTRDTTWELYIMNADGTSQQRLTFGGSASGPPRWSSDGRHIVYTSSSTAESGIWIIAPNGVDRKRLTSGVHVFPSLSPVRLPND